MDYPETQTTLGTRHRMKTNKTNTENEKESNTDLKPGMLDCKVLTEFTSLFKKLKYLCHRYVPLAVNTFQSFPHSWHIIEFVTRVTRQVPLLDEELLTVLEHLVLSGVCVTRSLVLCVMFCRYLFVLFLLAIVLSVLRFMDSNYPFGSFKLFLYMMLDIYMYFALNLRMW